MHVKLCCLASEKHCISPKMVSEAIYQSPDHLKSDGYGGDAVWFLLLPITMVTNFLAFLVSLMGVLKLISH